MGRSTAASRLTKTRRRSGIRADPHPPNQRPADTARSRLARAGPPHQNALPTAQYRRRTLPRRILVQLNRGEGRHQLARSIFHGKRGELRRRYREGQEDQLGALGIVVNLVVLWNTIYMATLPDAFCAQRTGPVRTPAAATGAALDEDHHRGSGRARQPRRRWLRRLRSSRRRLPKWLSCWRNMGKRSWASTPFRRRTKNECARPICWSGLLQFVEISTTIQHAAALTGRVAERITHGSCP